MSEFNTPEENEKAKNYRLQVFENTMREQFQLSYFGHISYEASEQMTVQERHTMYHILVEQKQDERKQQEDAIKAAKAKSSSGGRRGRH